MGSDREGLLILIVMLIDPIEIALKVAEIFEQLGVPYAIGGSLASSVRGEARSSQGVDFVADLQLAHVEAFIVALKDAFHVDSEAIRKAVRERWSFNIIHLESLFKVDVFVPAPKSLGREAMSRRRREVLRVAPERSAFVAAPEYMVIQKLDWFRQGGGASDLQWRDVLGILKVQGARLDRPYLRQMATTLGFSDLFEKALLESGLSEEAP